MKLLIKQAELIDPTGQCSGTQDILMENGVIAAAAADVMEIEPLPAESPLWRQPNMVITPHISGGFHLPATLENIVEISFGNFAAWLKGENLRNEIDFSTGYKK